MREPNIDAVVGEVRRTGMPGVVLVCGDSLMAFGPIFGSEDSARSFLAYLARYSIDARSLSPHAMADAHRRWMAEVASGETFDLVTDTWPAPPQETP